MPDDSKEFDIVPGLRYEITIAPDNKAQGTSSNRATVLRSHLQELLEKASIRYYLRMEYTMPQFGDAFNNTIARIHYHGFIRFDTYDDIYHFYVNYWHRFTEHHRVQLNYSPKDRLQYWTDYFKKNQLYVPRYLQVISNSDLRLFLESPCSPPEEN